MSKSGDTRKQKQNDFDARMNPPLSPELKQKVRQMEKLKSPASSSTAWNSAITRCINITKGI
jgi:hypothetical protein